MTIAATLPVDSVWTRKTTSLCHFSSSHPSVISSCQLVVALPLVALLLCRPLLVLSSCQAPACCSVTSRHPLIAPPSRLLVAPAGCHIVSCRPIVALSSTRRASLLSCYLSLSVCCAPCRPALLLSLCQLVVASPLDAPPSCHLVVSSCRLSLSRHAS
jgi:hypothetical protein